jgi:palmitoyltransferase
MFNAIGYFNYRYFVNFLIYIFVGMFYGMTISLEPFMLLSSGPYIQQWRIEKKSGRLPTRLHPMLPRREEQMLLTLSFMLCAAVGFAVLLLGGFHIYLTFT